MQRTLLHRLPRHLSRRSLSTTTRKPYSSPFESGPAPPRLPKEEQEIFERLQRQSTGAFSTPREDPSSTIANDAASPSLAPRIRVNQSPDSGEVAEGVVDKVVIPEGEEVHPNLRRGAPPEFEGDVNPKTGEVGGPKNEPLRWGAQGDWSFNGRVTDF